MRATRRVRACVVLSAVFLLVLTTASFGRPYLGEEELFTQPDGTQIPLLLHGDEFFIRAETHDGYTVVRDAKSGWLCYAQLSADGESFVSTGIPVAAAGKGKSEGVGLAKGLRLSENALRRKTESSRTNLFHGAQPDYATRMDALAKSAAIDTLPPRKTLSSFSGVCMGLCVVWDFSDAPITASYPSADSAIRFLGKKFNSLDAKDNSLRYSFRTWSGGKFDLQYVVKGVYRAPKTFAYYDSIAYGTGHNLLLKTALDSLKAQGFDFSQLSIKSGGTSIRALCICNTGKAATWAQGMWAHSGRCNFTFTANGVKVGSYCTGSATGGALSHEHGHLVAEWPDLYSSTDVPTGCWDIMGSGTSSLADPYLLYLNGWDDVVNIANFGAGTVVTASGKNQNVGHIYYRNARPNEFFFFKPYTKQLPLCASIPDQGLTIWHINKKGDNFNYPSTPLLVQMVHANNDITNTRTNVCFKSGGKDAFSSVTVPSALWVDTTNSGLDINKVSASDTIMTFTINGSSTSALPENGYGAPAPYSMGLTKRGGRLALAIAGSAAGWGATLLLCTAAGKTVLQRAVYAGETSIDVTHLPAGLYIARLSNETINTIKKIVIGPQQ
jgi:M6 family metalloprotease-like protein